MADTNWVDGVTVILAAWMQDVNDYTYRSAPKWCGTAGGTANALTLAPVSTNLAITAYLAGQSFVFKAGASGNTAATTVAINGLATVAVQVSGAACIGGEIKAGKFYRLTLDTTSTAQLESMDDQPISGSTASTFTFDGTGGSTGSLTLNWRKTGSWVDLDIPAALATTGTGSTVLTSNTALPAGIRPAAQHAFGVNRMTNGGAAVNSAGVLSVTTGGIIQILLNGSNAAFTDATSGGMNLATTVRYFSA